MVKFLCKSLFQVVLLLSLTIPYSGIMSSAVQADAETDSIYYYAQTLTTDNSTGTLSLEGGVSVPYHFYKYTTDQTISASTNLGDATNDDEMVIVRYDGNLTINTGQTLTTLARKRGLVIYVKGNLTDNGTISMTGKGAYNVAGQNLLIMEAAGSSYTVPDNACGAGGVSGGTGSAGTSYSGGNGGGGSPGALCGGGYLPCYCDGTSPTNASASAAGNGGTGAYTGILNYVADCWHGGGGGGAGNTVGSAACNCASGGCGGNGSAGAGGLLILIVDGVISFSGATLSSAGAAGGAGGAPSGDVSARGGDQGGGSGGGVIKYFYGSKTGTPTTNVTGGAVNGVAGSVNGYSFFLTVNNSIYSYAKTLTTDNSTGTLSLYGGVSVPYHFYKETSDKTYSDNTTLGDATNDDEMVIVRYDHNMTLDVGQTLTTTARKRGLVLYVAENCTINGTISMTNRGAKDVAGQNLLIISKLQDYIDRLEIGSTVLSNEAGCGGAGGGGGAGAAGTSYSGGAGGGGGSSCGSDCACTSPTAGSANGGSGGNGARGSVDTVVYGTTGVAVFYYGGGGGGAGNDGGTVNTGCCSGSPSQVVGSNGTGGLLILIVDGALTFGGSSTLSSAGADGGAGGVCTDSTGGQGGGSGGGVIKYFYGSKTGTPTTNVTGGALNGCSGTVTLMSIPVINNDTDSYNFGAIAPIESYTTGLDYFTLTNTGIVNIDVFIDGTDMIGSGCTTMTLSNIGVADNNTYGLMTGLEGTDYDIIVRRNPYYSVLKWNLGYVSENNTQKWGLKLIAPTAYTGACAGGLSGNVTLSATVH